ncbi:unnamed protein product, partial [Mesorhabditis belari]|uniref:Uncharacterized protein n=1 Tax=Mesorhabditis belari TaxID=2138241 RepID=A0AAF3EK79_9BILA
MLLWTCLLASLFIGFSTAADICPTPTIATCDPMVYDCCDNNFSNALNLTTCNNLPDTFSRVECYRTQMESMFGNSIDGGLNVCAAYSDWTRCLGVSLLSCESIKFHIQQGLTSGQAINVYTVYSQMAFLCGPGLDTYVNNDACVRNVFNVYNDQLARCRATFSANINNNWNNRCQDFRELLGCYQMPFQQMCGKEVGWFGCEYERSGITAWLPECSEQCFANNS